MNIRVKIELVDCGVPGSPTLWRDFKSPEDANVAHELYVDSSMFILHEK